MIQHTCVCLCHNINRILFLYEFLLFFLDGASHPELSPVHEYLARIFTELDSETVNLFQVFVGDLSRHDERQRRDKMG